MFWRQPKLQMKQRIQELMTLFHINRAVIYGILTNGWRFISGPITLILIAQSFTKETQGYYFTFSSLMALQIFIELGLGSVIINFASHEWSKLGLNENGEIVGDRIAGSRLASLGQFSLKWFSIGGAVFALAISIWGFNFFLLNPTHGVDWTGPWIALCISTSISIVLTPLWLLLEGCNQVSNAYLFRMYQGVYMTLASWTAVTMGAELWSPVVSAITGIIVTIYFLYGKYRQFYRSIFLFSVENRIRWREELLPMQWRLAVASLGGYFIGSAMTPIVFHYLGPIEAGQFGMTYSLVSAVGGVAAMWGSVRTAQFGMLASKHEYGEMTKLLAQLLIIGAVVLFGLGALMWLAIWISNLKEYKFAQRLLPPLPTFFLIIGMIASTICHPISIYLRAHRREPFLALSIVLGLLTLIATLILVQYLGTTGVTLAYAMIGTLVGIPWTCIIYFRAKQQWQTH
jgi:O-antigen/teichoic acid export membrane protein